ncbi:ATP-binding protein [Streptosporangium sp. H16]|uniref:ATP-binding protein n=1 Tax=Streptosporangium sp. H16 TaxID=3444184 RepID=UPI003F7AF62A
MDDGGKPAARSVRQRVVILASGPVLGAVAGVLTNLITTAWNWWLFSGLVVVVGMATVIVVLTEDQFRANRPVPPEPARRAPLSGLPRNPTNFVGRTREVAELERLLAGRRSGSGTVCAVTGMGGVGKTTLVLQVVHRLKTAYPDGVLFIDMHGQAGSRAVSAGEVLGRFLGRLGVPGEFVPAHVEERAAMFGDRVAGKRMLIVLDNVRDAQHVAPILSSPGGCDIIVSSRNTLNALECEWRLELAPLPVDEAKELLRLSGAVATATPDTATDALMERIVERCGRLPLMICIASARLRSGSVTGLDDLDDRLADERQRLEEIDDGERDAAAVFRVSFKALSPGLQRAFTALALHTGNEFGVGAAMALLGESPQGTERSLGRLVDANLLVRHAPGRHRFHDLVRTFAEQVATTELDAGERESALLRVIDYYLHAVDRADRVITPERYREPLPSPEPAGLPDLSGYEAALGWMVAEQRNAVAACQAAGRHGFDDRCWQLAYGLRGFFFITKPVDDWIETHTWALAAARRAGARQAEARTLNDLGLAVMHTGDLDTAAGHYHRAMTLFEELGDAYGASTALAHHAWIHHYRGDHEEALRESFQAFDFVGAHGSRRRRAIMLRDIAFIETKLGRYHAAVGRLPEALQIFEDLGLHVDAAMTLNCLGEAYLPLGQWTAAEKAFSAAVESGRSGGSLFEEARAHDHLGSLAARSGDDAQARIHWTVALAHYSTVHAKGRARLLRTRLETLEDHTPSVAS